MSGPDDEFSQTRDAPYDPIPEPARIWHPIALLIGSFLAFYFWALVPSIVLVAIDAAAGKTNPLAPDTLTSRYGLAALGASFALVLLHFLFWTRAVERRPLTSIGMFRGTRGLYTNGLIYGAMFAIIVNLLAAIASLQLGFEMPQMFEGTQTNFEPGILLFAALIVPVVLLQAGTEEVVFRGWMLSAFSARTSITLAVLLSSLAFGAFHLDRFVVDTKFALIFISGTVVLGTFLAVWAVQSGSIAGPAGFHGAYNSLLFVSGFLDAAADAKPGTPATNIWNQMMSLEAMQTESRYTDYVATLETAVVVCALIGIVSLLTTSSRTTA